MKKRIKAILSIIYHANKYVSDSRKAGDKRSKGVIIRDIILLNVKYEMPVSEYLKYGLGVKTGDEREQIVSVFRDKMIWKKDYNDNRKFLYKYTARKYENSLKLRKKRLRAYTDRYHLGKNCIIQFNVEFSREHFLNGTMKVGNKVLFAKNVFIDYSGELIIHDNVSIANGVIIETHTHVLEENRIAPVPGRLEISDNVKILTRAYIADTCHSIGRGARIGAGSYVRNNVPPYAIVMGNPAKVIGFLYSPKEMVAYEEEKYAESDRTSIETYSKYYEKYYRNRSKELKQYVKL